MFSRARNSMKLFSISRNSSEKEIQNDGSQTGILISQPAYNVAVHFQRLDTHIFQLHAWIQKKLFSILCNANGSQISKMAGWRLTNRKYVYLDLAVYNVDANFQMLYPCFWGWGIPLSNFPYRVMQAEVRNPRWRHGGYPSGNTCIWACMLNS